MCPHRSLRPIVVLLPLLGTLLFPLSGTRGGKQPDVRFPPELIKFVPHNKNPVFTGGPRRTQRLARSVQIVGPHLPDGTFGN